MNVLFYAYYLADKDIPKIDADWAPLKIKQWVKGEPIRGSFTVPLVGGGVQTFSADNKAKFFATMWRSLAHRLGGVLQEPHALIPIPGREVVHGHQGSYRTFEYAEALAEFKPSLLTAVDALRWKEVRDAQRGTSGWRSPQPRYENLEVIWKPDRPCILFDDICTSGSSMVAAQWRLEEVGASVDLATAILRPTHERHEKMTGWFEEPCPVFTRSLGL